MSNLLKEKKELKLVFSFFGKYNINVKLNEKPNDLSSIMMNYYDLSIEVHYQVQNRNIFQYSITQKDLYLLY